MNQTSLITDKAEFAQEGIFFCAPIIYLMNLINKKVGNQKTKPTFITSILKVEY